MFVKNVVPWNLVALKNVDLYLKSAVVKENSSYSEIL
jgi:hypothetical protein